MKRVLTRSACRRNRENDSFTLIELLVVMTIIAILAALILAAGNAVMIKGMRSRASAEIQALSAAAESYKADNGIYPQGDGNLLTNGSSGGTVYTADDGTASGGEYQTNSNLLFSALSGQTNYTVAPVAGIKAYMSFKVNQVTTPTTGANSGFTYIHDPWGAAYGYSTGSAIGGATTNYPYNGNGFFDLWSTGGVTLIKYAAKNSLTNAWISNWTQ
jgi:prepilin-type N-terminal cleavage/methylation domain-containing protein